jgi:alginate O-acetyltransferase complex protein AlgI
MVGKQTVNPEVIYIVFCALLAVPLAWFLPKERIWVGIALWTLLVIASLSLLSALWLIGASVLTSVAMTAGDKLGHKNFLTLCCSVTLVGSLLLSNMISGILWIGGAYFILRNLHVLFDWWMGRIVNPGLERYLRYQLFLPVLIAGPINRIQHFERQCARHRWDSAIFFTGAERALFGTVQLVVMGGWLIDKIQFKLAENEISSGIFWYDWLASVLDWARLYFTFAGFTSLALGIALMMGLTLEENFNQPWKARNLIEFWSRWHITLSQWCRDYVFQPVTAMTRSPILGLIAAMIVIGMWHEVSVYYLLWAVWQAAGIIATRVTMLCIERNPRLAVWPSAVPYLGPIFVMCWLSLAKPVLSRFLEIDLS